MGEKPEKASDYHFIALWDIYSCHGERADLHGRFIPYSKRPGAISMYPAGIIPAQRILTKSEVVVCAADPLLINEIKKTLTGAKPSH